MANVPNCPIVIVLFETAFCEAFQNIQIGQLDIVVTMTILFDK